MLCVLLAATACSSRTKSSDFPSEMVDFVPYSGNPVFTGTGSDTWDKKIRERGYILYEDNMYKMWYTGYNPDTSQQRFLGYATSTDGIHWTRYSDKPIFTGKWAEDVDIVKSEGKYYMYSEGYKDVAHFLVSDDGINWQEKGDLVIRTAEGDTIPGPYGTPTAMVENGNWYLFYERNDSAVWLAKSDDKITWTNVQNNPVLKPGPDEYDRAAIAADQIVKYRGKYYLYYHATARLDWQHPTSPVLWSSEVAMSTDLLHWKKYPGNPIVKGDHSSPILVFDGKNPSLYTVHAEVWRYSPE